MVCARSCTTLHVMRRGSCGREGAANGNCTAYRWKPGSCRQRASKAWMLDLPCQASSAHGAAMTQAMAIQYASQGAGQQDLRIIAAAKH